jgi:hypothetical protein
MMTTTTPFSAEIGALLNEVGQLLAEDAEYPLDGTLLHAEVDQGYVSPSIYKDLGDHAFYRQPDLDRLGNCLLDLWEAYPPNMRWAEMLYVVRGQTFEASFIYPRDLDPKEWPMDRRERLVKAHFGDKPVVYPPWEDGEGDFAL